jgi:hypothetical protein
MVRTMSEGHSRRRPPGVWHAPLAQLPPDVAHALNDRGARQVNLYRALSSSRVSAYVMVPPVLSALGVEIESGEAS